MTKVVIWSSDLFETELEYCREIYTQLSESEMVEMAIDSTYMMLEDERHNLDFPLDGDIIAIADLGLWNGRKRAYKIFENASIGDMMHSECDIAEWYVDSKKDLCFSGSHHDGHNYYTYRMLRPELSDKQIDNFEEKLYNGTATSKDLTRYTKRLGDLVLDKYGF